jgi:hypothetical protein
VLSRRIPFYFNPGFDKSFLPGYVSPERSQQSQADDDAQPEHRQYDAAETQAQFRRVADEE